MLPASTQMAGLCLAVPDVCKTPSPVGPVPIPYPNTAQMPLAVNTSLKVFVLGMPAVTLRSQIPVSEGDEPGVAGGVASGVFKGPCSFSKGSTKVIVGGAPWVHLGAMTRQNGVAPNNPAGAVVAPSQVKVLVPP